MSKLPPSWSRAGITRNCLPRSNWICFMFFSIIFPNPGWLSTRAACIINLHWIEFLFSEYGASYNFKHSGFHSSSYSIPAPVPCAHIHSALISKASGSLLWRELIHSSYGGVNSTVCPRNKDIIVLTPATYLTTTAWKKVDVMRLRKDLTQTTYPHDHVCSWLILYQP